MKKIVHIVGNRPQFIKLAPLYLAMEKRQYKSIIIHTGQHYDDNMSEIFFRQLGLPKPYINLGVGSGSHGEMTGKAIQSIEKTLIEIDPFGVIVYGDTNSTLAGALAAKKLNLQVAHIEAGPRIFNKKNPEEINRIMVDHISDILFCPDQISMSNLSREGLINNKYFIGDLMYDSYNIFSTKNFESNLDSLFESDRKYVLLTFHRQENTVDSKKLAKLIDLLDRIDYKILFPVHPRTKYAFIKNNLWDKLNANQNLIILPPLGYLEIINILKKVVAVMSDSGGLSKESYFAKKKCLFLWNEDVWPELISNKWLFPIDLGEESSINKALDFIRDNTVEGLSRSNFFGNGNAAKKAIDILEEEMWFSE